ncbi:uncharacterized protein A1O5_10848 [Cladophialophora psammophila CBS 110553]|uniref:Enoyl reductase (ER) domain-containing protein n=1 Tax=Cladophialophora psammophila CBS 110553 TaxID=1182543 RepID=W9WDP7_9EURO|nr:uncharacterized protein A1O5_10848 [Cladophialophora psammophila CBS 110553]EXJ66232.1 hypothetical protein A1O5_10848 [Cladophialophora psammophila CBS 110553]
MKEVINFAGPSSKIVDSSIPEPGEDDVFIKVVVSGTNPKDWKLPDFAQGYPHDDGSMLARARNGLNQGDDIAGIVEKVGKNVVEFKPGERVAGFHRMATPGGSYAEYAIAPSWTTFHLPTKTSFEEAVTIPLAGLTAVMALYEKLLLPLPWSPATDSIPLIVYGASTAVGAFAIKLAQLSNIHPIIAIAGKGIPFVETLVDKSKGDIIIDYRGGAAQTVKSIEAYLTDTEKRVAKHAMDCVIVEQSAEVLRQVVPSDGHITWLFPNTFNVSPIKATTTNVGSAHNQDGLGDSRELAFVFSRWFTYALQNGKFSGHPFEIRKGGLGAVEQALRDLKEGKASAVKYVIPI